MIIGRVIKLGDDINTDLVIAGRYKFRSVTIEDMAKHIFEDLDPTLAARIKPGDIIVAGKNFGSGSSREQAPRVMVAAGIAAVVAKSFARIFFRNAINVGLPALTVEERFVDLTSDGDLLEVDFATGFVRNITKKYEAKFKPFPRQLLEILEAGGLVPYVKKKGFLI
ncbi:MAG: 3-isopropylmalate dehydratase [Nitrososphaerota archaeon]|nr:3-isopropylmalate dehydratase [Candidatus Bathyarchaeota archaeon]MDW8022334.1 3-isopropylmalate dehydratase [Nitrososphaerota archaeon]